MNTLTRPNWLTPLAVLALLLLVACGGGGGGGTTAQPVVQQPPPPPVVNCDEDLFNAECLPIARYDAMRMTRVIDCDTNRDPTLCPPPVLDCIDTPFDTTELCANQAFAPVRIMRVSFCMTGNTGDDRCTQDILNCIATPFAPGCENPAYDAARVNACIGGTRTGSDCTQLLSQNCPSRSFEGVCLNDTAYDGERLTACRNNTNGSGDCRAIRAQFCNANPFNADSFTSTGGTCLGDSAYNPLRINACIGGTRTGSDCTALLSQNCPSRAFEGVCLTNIAYDDDRIPICRNGPTRTDCTATIARHCTAMPFDAIAFVNNGGACLLNLAYDNLRLTACRSSSVTGNDCTDTIGRFCTNNIFDAVLYDGEACLNRTAYAAERVDFCVDDVTQSPFNPACPGILSQCNTAPFDTACSNDTFDFARARECRADPTVVGNCADILQTFCPTNPFDDSCFDDAAYDGERLMLVEDCITQQSTSNECIEIDFTCQFAPFNAACVNEQYAAARLMRVASCAGVTTPTTDCTQPILDCIAAPFGASCTDAAYAEARLMRVTSCAGITTPTTDCTQPILDCIAEPFGAGCDPNAYAVPREELVLSCDNTLRTRGERFTASECAPILVCLRLFADLFDADNPLCAEQSFDTLRIEVCTNDISNTHCSDAILACLTGDPDDPDDPGDPFADACLDDAYDYTRVEYCSNDLIILPNRLGACKRIVEACQSDPFKRICSNNTYDPDRERLCEIPPLQGTETCAFTIRYVCEAINNVFSPVCDGNPTYEQRRRTTCLNPPPENDHLTSFGCSLLRESICPFNPFDALCYRDEEYKTTRVLYRIDCRDNPDAEDCDAIPALTPDNESWLTGFATGELPPATADISQPQNQFLRGTVFGLDVGEVTAQGAPDPITDRLPTPDVHRLNLSDGDLGGDTADGVTFFSGFINGADYFYAGLLADADLGELLTRNSGTARWDGRIHGLASNFNRMIFETDFTLEVGFSANGGTIQAFVPSLTATHFLYLNGDFDDTGRISGTTNFAQFTGNVRDGATTDDSTGEFNGIIGSQGALGVFLSDSNGAGNSYGGGFVAVPAPPADYAVWEAATLSGDAPEEDDRSFFVGGVTGAGSTFDLGEDVTDKIPRVTFLPSSTTNEGFAIAAGTFSDGIRRYYSSILTATGTLGGQIVSDSAATARFDGFARFVRGIQQQIEMDDFSLTFSFDRLSFTASASSTNTSDDFTLKITEGRISNNGLIRGGVALLTNTDSGDFNRGAITGIIGNEGAVGVIKTGFAGSLGHFAGGFVAERNPCDFDLFGAGCLGGPHYADAQTTRALFCTHNPSDTTLCTPQIRACIDGTSQASDCTNPAYAAARVAFCLTDIYDNPLCTTAILDCIDAPFEGDCANNPAYDMARVEFCIGKAPSANCTQPILTCIADPFTPDCADTVYNHIRTTACKNPPFEGTETCAPTIQRVCQDEADVFSLLCDGDDAVEQERLAFCSGVDDVSIGATSAAGKKCFDAIDTACSVDSFDVLCYLDDSYVDDRAYERAACDEGLTADMEYCEGLPALTRANLESWMTGFGTSDQPPPIADATASANMFLQGTLGGLDVGDVKASGDADPSVINLNLSSIGGSASDGVAFFTGEIGGADYFYAGVLSGTDLGALPTQTSTAMWNGRIRALGGDNRNFAEKAFMLEIDFGVARTIEAFVQSTGDYHLHLEGTFDGTGRIDGTANFASFANTSDRAVSTNDSMGVFNGLIGAQGAVGVFLSDDGGTTSSYGGGFIASPTAPNP